MKRELVPVVALLAGLLVSGCAIRYEHVNVLSSPLPVRVDLGRNHPAPAFTVITDGQEAAVRYLASPGLDGRRPGSEGSRLAREYLIERLRGAGLSPLFGDTYEQTVFDGDEAYSTNVGAVYPTDDPDADWVVLVAHYDHLGDGHLGADDNAAAVALILSLAEGLARDPPPFRRHVAVLFPDSEEPPSVRTDVMGSTWFWNHPPLPLGRLHLAIVIDLIAGRASDAHRAAGLGGALLVTGAEASAELAQFARGVPPEPGMELLFASSAVVETYPYVPWKRFSASDYHGLRDAGARPFLFLSTGRTHRYHTELDTADSLDYERLARNTRYVARLLTEAADSPDPLTWNDRRADPVADVDLVLRLHEGIDPGAHPALLRSALRSDRRTMESLRTRLRAGESISHGDYHDIQLAAIRVQAAAFHPSGWWFALW